MMLKKLRALAGAALRLLERNLTISARLTLWFSMLLTIVLAFFSSVVYLTLDRGGKAEVATLVATHAQQVLAQVEAEDGHPRVSEPIHLAPSGTQVALYDGRGNRLLGEAVPGVLPEKMGVPPTGSQPQHLEVHGQGWFVVTLPVEDGGRVIAWVRAARTTQGVEATSHRFLFLLLAAAPPFLLVGALGGLFISRRALGAIDRITRTARAIGQGNLSERVRVPSANDEVGHLAQTFNEMLGRLEAAFERQRQFTADASHELRTPLAVVAAQTEDALHLPALPPEAKAALITIQAETQRMAKLIAQLLFLARSDSSRLGLEYEELDLAALVRDVAAELAAAAAAKGLEFKVEAPASLTFWGDQTQLTRLLINLVENAIKYTSRGQVRVRLTAKEGGIVLAVADTGPGIPPEALPHIFERFYRLDKARSRANGGTGLGLAIARWIVTAHGGRIDVQSQVGRGTTFTVWLPPGS
ncbi:MAG: hypothetical protein PWR31_1758 [Bacillota bacterium]|nr:hypothetical protein [Bacillota bacterium]